jgi:Tfp pilus assembly protein PilX
MSPTSKAKPRPGIGLGITTLVTIFMVLLLTIFSVLTLATAEYDSRLSRQAIDASGEYYAADDAACQWLADVSTLLESTPPERWAAAISSTNADSITSPRTEDSGQLLVSRSFPINQRLELKVGLSISADGNITIIEWRSINRFEE